MTEQSIIGARASVMVYDDNQKKWVPSGSSSGLSKVQIYHHQQNNTFRVVGRKLQDHEVVINCSILKGLKYNQATATFHQWRDSKYVYGLNFSSQQDAENFARAMTHALEVLSGRVSNQQGGPPTNGNGFEEDMGYRTMTSEDAAILRQQQQITGQVTPSAQTPTSQTNQNNIPNSPPTPQGHHRTSSAPPAPQPQQMPVSQQQSQHIYGQNPSIQNQNGISHQQQPQVSPATNQQQYHAPQQIAQQHGLYATQQILNASGYQQPQQQNQPTCVPQQSITGGHQANQNNGPIYVSSQHQISQGLSSSASANSVVYASQQQMGSGLPAHQQAVQNGQAVAISNSYSQLNSSQAQQQQQQPVLQHQENPYGQLPINSQILQTVSASNSGVPIAPPLNRLNSSSSNSGAPAAPPPPPFGGFNAVASVTAPPAAPQPPAPPAPPMMTAGAAAAPPPPPPPPMGGLNSKKDDPQADLMGSLAAQLQQAKLKKNKSTASSAESNVNNSSGSNGNYGTIGRSSTGMASMMDEMAKTLARRRAQAERKEPESENDSKQRPWEKSNTLPHKLGNSNSNSTATNSSNAANSGGESPRPMRKRFGSASEETILKVNGDGLSLAISASDLDTLKSEIVREMRAEIQKVKQDIIDAIRSEFNRR